MVYILDKNLDFRKIEDKWNKRWDESGVYRFNPEASGPVYSFDTPPPFTSGTLHMGHVYNHVWIDIVARYKRMRGFNVYLPQGFDCHGLPTELRVEKDLKVSKEDREEFIRRCREWTDAAVSRMRNQFRSIGYSADWDYSYRTMDEGYKALVQKTLLMFYQRDLLYREKHPVLWCPECGTALAKAEVGYLEKEGGLYYINLDCGGRKLTIATTRPEMMPACVAVLVNPADERYIEFVGKKAVLPLFNREVPVISDEAVDMEYGTGVVYLCTFGDEQDIAWQKKYRLPVLEAVDCRGCMTPLAGKYAGMKVSEAREAIISDLKQIGVVSKIVEHRHNVLCHVERSSCKAPIELLPMEQWFIKVRDYIPEIIKAAKEMNWYPEYMLQRLIDWAESMDWDWIISRQRVFGTPIPFWVCGCGNVVPASPEELPVDPRGTVRRCPTCGGDAVGETDVCDCWVDSSVTPLWISRWGVDDRFFKKTYPASLRPQGYEIIRTWTFYTLYRCLILTEKPCFRDLVINGMVCGPDGRKMSKSLGNVIEPDEPLSKYSADTVRQWAAGGSLGDDYPFSWEECEHSQKFLTKLWNVSRFIEMHLSDFNGSRPERFNEVDRWILSKLQRLLKEVTACLDGYVFNKPIEAIRSFVWHDLADYYLEMVKHRLYKPEVYGFDSRRSAQYTLRYVMDVVVKMLHPFTPYISEELRECLLREDCSRNPVWPVLDESFIDGEVEELGGVLRDIVADVRKYKSDKGMSLAAELGYVVLTCAPEYLERLEAVRSDIEGTCKIKCLEIRGSEEVERFVMKFLD